MLLKWISTSTADALGRLLLQVLTTAILARLLDPETFGLSTLTIVYVGALSLLSSTLFEESLTRSRRLRNEHFRAALTAALLASSALYGLLIVLATIGVFGSGSTAGAVLGLASIYGLTVIVDAADSVFSAAARRLRLFNLMALSNFLGVLCGSATGILVAHLGGGVWALLVVPMVTKSVTLLLLVLRVPLRIRPGVSLAPARGLIRFGFFVMGARSMTGVTEALTQTLVNRFFGLEGNGYLNMAMRIIEPIRGMAQSVGYNLSMAYFAPLQHDTRRLADSVQRTIADSAWLTQPVFIGLAVTAPTLVALLAGDGWQTSGRLAVFLAAAAALSLVNTFIYAGLSARGRGDAWLLSSLIELGVVLLVMSLTHPLGVVSVGIARVCVMLADTAYSLSVAYRDFGISMVGLLRLLMPVSVCTLVMSAAVVGQGRLGWLDDHPLTARLAVEVATGVMVYVGLLIAFQRTALRSLASRLRT